MRNSEVVFSDFEKEAAEIVSGVVSSYVVERRTKNYLSFIAPNGLDFCRVKFGPRSNWFSLELLFCSDEIRADPRLSSVKNKNQRHWIIEVSCVADMLNYSDLILASYNRCNSVSTGISL